MKTEEELLEVLEQELPPRTAVESLIQYYQERIKGYQIEVAHLQEELKKAKRFKDGRKL